MPKDTPYNEIWVGIGIGVEVEWIQKGLGVYRGHKMSLGDHVLYDMRL